MMSNKKPQREPNNAESRPRYQAEIRHTPQTTKGGRAHGRLQQPPPTNPPNKALSKRSNMVLTDLQTLAKPE